MKKYGIYEDIHRLPRRSVSSSQRYTDCHAPAVLAMTGKIASVSSLVMTAFCVIARKPSGDRGNLITQCRLASPFELTMTQNVVIATARRSRGGKQSGVYLMRRLPSSFCELTTVRGLPPLRTGNNTTFEFMILKVIYEITY
jgi:hypothetical protein